MFSSACINFENLDCLKNNMNPVTAEKIVNEYGKVLEQTSHLVFGAPESLLPYKKEIIKEAIKVTLDILEPEEQEIREHLRVGYMELARFIPDEEAEIASIGQNLLTSCSPNASKEEILEYLKHTTIPEASKYIDLAIEISKKISTEQKALLEEIRDYSESTKEKQSLSKIITYKNDKYRCFCQIKLNSGERILISIAGTPTPSIKVSKLALGGLYPYRQYGSITRQWRVVMKPMQEKYFTCLGTLKVKNIHLTP